MTRSSYVRRLTRFDKGNLSGLLPILTKQFKLNLITRKLNFYWGLAYSDLKQMPKSIADYSKDLALNGGYVDAYYNQGLVLSVMEDKPGAIADYTQVIRLDRNFAPAYNNRGLALSDLRDQRFQSSAANQSRSR